jgi:undecaprenyl diphosphate synthase
VRTVIETCSQMRIQTLTLYAFSIENWKRPRTEIEMLWRLLRTYLRLELPEMMRQQIRMNAIGRLDALPPQVHAELLEVLEETAANRGLQVNLAINYGGRAEIVDAVKALVEAARRGEVTAESIDEAAISAHLYTAGIPDPDLLIRTSGEMRVSNFLLWQIAYAELYVTDTLWPDFTRADLLRAIRRQSASLSRSPSDFTAQIGTGPHREFLGTAVRCALSRAILVPYRLGDARLPQWVFYVVLAATGLLASDGFDNTRGKRNRTRRLPGIAAGPVASSDRVMLV